MVDIDKFCADLESCVGKAGYAHDGQKQSLSLTAIRNGAPTMCAGLVVAALKEQRFDLYNGTNTIWRKYLSDKGSVSDHTSSNGYPKNVHPLRSSQLKKGMAVFKWNKNDTPKYPDGQGDYQHIGIVTSEKPFRIVHCTSENNYQGVVVQTTIGKFCAYGYIKGLDYQSSGDQPGGGGDMLYNLGRVTASSLNIRQSPTTKSAVIGSLTRDMQVQVEVQGDWCKLIHQDGYVSSSYIQIIGQVQGEPPAAPEQDVDQRDDADDVDEILDRLVELNGQMIGLINKLRR